MMKNVYDIVKRPVITEQSMESVADKKYVFMVDVDANKTEIKAAIEEIFGVKVAKVNTIRMMGKMKRNGAYPAGRRASYKKAVVTLTADSKTIEFFEGMV
ncbi:MAG: 50S ribosomal protein L23 [Firmicutes bacterium]|nr:50S ribosomal protein L23 [Bacillota bacterium]